MCKQIIIDTAVLPADMVRYKTRVFQIKFSRVMRLHTRFKQVGLGAMFWVYVKPSVRLIVKRAKLIKLYSNKAICGNWLS